jgi:polyferredoxin
MRTTRWYDFFWALLVISMLLPLYSVHLVWLSLAFMAAPFVVTLFANSKTYCNNYCGRGQLYQLLGGRLKLSLNRRPPRFLRARWFRLCFFAVFLVKFGMMMRAEPGSVEAAGDLQMMLLMTTALGVAAMVLFKPRSWCVCCPMGTMTQEMCRIRNRKDA